MRATLVRRCGAALALAGLACSGPKNRGPMCGLALVAGPTIVQQQINNARALLGDVPRGLPPLLPARIAGTSDTGQVHVGYDGGKLVMGYDGAGFPLRVPRDAGFGLLVVDDTSQRVIGVLVYESVRPPQDYPQLGTITSGALALPLYGVRVDWSGVSNPRCPLLGAPEPER